MEEAGRKRKANIINRGKIASAEIRDFYPFVEMERNGDSIECWFG